mmetsp:Transcript_63316/g.185105  ORF Transcript_63316/g.185105 Transcript_63316/m.185105 type:complete len:255 (-) Transcript_63316:275-1039(-)
MRRRTHLLVSLGRTAGLAVLQPQLDSRQAFKAHRTLNSQEHAKCHSAHGTPKKHAPAPQAGGRVSQFGHACLPSGCEVSMELPVMPNGGADLVASSDAGWPTAGRGCLWTVAHHCDSLNDALALEILENAVLRLSVVPDGDGTRAPAVADGELWLLHPFRQVVQQHGALIMTHLHNATREMFAHVEQLSTSDGMRPHHGMYCSLLRMTVRLCVVESSEAVAKILHWRGEGIVSPAERSPHGIPTHIGAFDHVQN